MLISYLMCVFSICSFLGWIAECVYVSLLQGGWVNRGFLFGPACPIYGVGAVLLYVTFYHIGAVGLPFGALRVFVASMIGASVLEYVTSYVLELIFHARWWDYTHMPLNLNGRICLPFALLFGFGGMIFYLYVAPIFQVLEDASNPQVIEVIALLCAAIFTADLTLTTSAQIDLTKKLEDATADFDAVMTVAVSDALQAATGVAQSASQTAQAAELAVKGAADTLTGIQRHALANIRRYTKPTTDAAAAALRTALSRAKQVRRK